MLNDDKVLVVEVKNEFVSHEHEETDDFFLVVHGRLTIQLRDRDVDLEEGELFVVPPGWRVDDRSAVGMSPPGSP